MVKDNLCQEVDEESSFSSNSTRFWCWFVLYLKQVSLVIRKIVNISC